MPTPLRSYWLACAVVAIAATSAHARDDADRQARRQELREQMQAERERWRAEAYGRARGPSGYGAPPPGDWGGHGYGPPAGYGVPPGHGAAPGQVPAPQYAPSPQYAPAPQYAPVPGGGWGAAPRLSPEERRALRQELRQHRP